MISNAKPKVAFVCVHNSCRSQIAQALGTHFASEIFESYSAGTAPSDAINPDALRLVSERYGIDMSATQHPKMLAELPAVDVLITMGCSVQCPSVPALIHEDWGLEDPTGKGDRVMNACIDAIEVRVKKLAQLLMGSE